MTTKFQEKVYAILKKVPKGKVTTYKALAKTLGSKAYRSIGTALNKNPYMSKELCSLDYTTKFEFLRTLMVPCHRVVNSNGSVGGFVSGAKNKIKLLKKEGVEVRNGKILDFEKVFMQPV